MTTPTTPTPRYHRDAIDPAYADAVTIRPEIAANYTPPTSTQLLERNARAASTAHGALGGTIGGLLDESERGRLIDLVHADVARILKERAPDDGTSRTWRARRAVLDSLGAVERDELARLGDRALARRAVVAFDHLARVRRDASVRDELQARRDDARVSISAELQTQREREQADRERASKARMVSRLDERRTGLTRTEQTTQHAAIAARTKPFTPRSDK